MGLPRRLWTLARMGGTSIARPAAAIWATDFLNAAYYARAPEERTAADLRLAFAILTTRWHRAGRRLGAADLLALERAFGRARLRSRGRLGRLERPDLIEGADRLLGPWFSAGLDDPWRTGWGIVFPSEAERDAYVPESRLAAAKVGALTPPRAPGAEREWRTYRPVPVADPDRLLARLVAPERWPDAGCDRGRFTPLRSRGLFAQTFEIELITGGGARLPAITRAYVTATRVETAAEPEGLAALVDELASGMSGAGASDTPLPDGHAPLAAVRLVTHSGHPIGRGMSHIVLSSGRDGAALRDVGCWDPMPAELRAAFAAGGARAQREFWGEGPPESSMLHQLAAA